jgi:outer membrane protein insertion porin family
MLRNTVDHPLNPSKGMKTQLGMTMVGGYVLRGDDHYVKYNPEMYLYFSPFHIPLFKSHPIVVELRADGQFINPPFQRSKVQGLQNRAANEWLETEDRLFVGGPETLRGWDYYDLELPDSWRMRMFHRIMYGAEVRIPVHPQYLWLVGFFDAGALFTDKFWEENYTASDMETINLDKQNKLLYDIRDIGDADLMGYFRYSYGFGFKIQIPMMPLRFWWGKKVLWVGEEKGYFQPISDYNFQFSIGDYRY